MSRANIDLSWLAPLLTKVPTAQENPLYSPDDTPEIAKKYGINSGDQIIPPTQWQRLVHPEQSAGIDNINNRLVSQPLLARQENSVRNAIGGSNFEITRPRQPEALKNLTPEQGYLMTGGDYRPTATGPEARALLNNTSDLPNLQSSGDVAAAKLNLANTTDALTRQPVVSAGLDQGAVNNLANELRVEPLKIELANKQLTNELGIQPSVVELRKRVIENQLNEAKNIVPLTQEAEQSEQALRGLVADTRLSDAPYAMGQAHNESIRGLVDSQRIPAFAPISNRVNENGTVSPLQKDPLGMSPMFMNMASLENGGIPGSTPTTTMKLPSGATIQVRTQPTDYEPLAGSRPTVARPSFAPQTLAPTTSISTPAVETPRIMPDVPHPDKKFGATKPTASPRTSYDPEKGRAGRIEELKNLLNNANSGRGTYMSRKEYEDYYTELTELLNPESAKAAK